MSPDVVMFFSGAFLGWLAGYCYGLVKRPKVTRLPEVNWRLLGVYVNRADDKRNRVTP